MRNCGIAVSAPGICVAKEPAGRRQIGVEIEGAPQSTPGFLVAAREQLVDPRRSMGKRVLVIKSDGLERRFGERCVRSGGTLTPAEHRLEMSSKGEIAVCHRIGRVQRDGLPQETPCFGKVALGKAADMPVRPHDAVPGVELILGSYAERAGFRPR